MSNSYLFFDLIYYANEQGSNLICLYLVIDIRFFINTILLNFCFIVNILYYLDIRASLTNYALLFDTIILISSN